ncbi:unnamed protein product, partial [Brassica oleracea]
MSHGERGFRGSEEALSIGLPPSTHHFFSAWDLRQL